MATPCSINPGFIYTVYPCAIDTSTQLPFAVDNQTPVKAEVVNRQREAIIAIESELGINPSNTYTTVRARLDALEGLISSMSGDSGGISIVSENNTPILTNATQLNFTGNIDVTDAGSGIATVNITGSSTLITVKEEGSTVDSAVSVLNFIGGLITATQLSPGNINITTAVPTLSQVLSSGNITSGNNIVLTGGSVISSSDGSVTVNDDLIITGKLTVAGLIDPTGLVLDEQVTKPANGTATKGVIWVRTDNKLIFTDQTNTDYELGAGGGVSTFDALTDTPADKTGKAGQVLIVSEDEARLEYAELPEAEAADVATISLTVSSITGGNGVTTASSMLLRGYRIGDRVHLRGQISATFSSGSPEYQPRTINFAAASFAGVASGQPNNIIGSFKAQTYGDDGDQTVCEPVYGEVNSDGSAVAYIGQRDRDPLSFGAGPTPVILDICYSVSP